MVFPAIELREIFGIALGIFAVILIYSCVRMAISGDLIGSFLMGIFGVILLVISIIWLGGKERR